MRSAMAEEKTLEDEERRRRIYLILFLRSVGFERKKKMSFSLYSSPPRGEEGGEAKYRRKEELWRSEVQFQL